VGLEPPAAKQRLMYNDGVEFYIDSHNDSRDTMDLNDYQFSMDINGNSAVFRGDRLDRYLKFSVPKEEGVANIVFRSAVRCMGTVNRMEDRDSMYQVEFAVEWASIGVNPLTGMEFNADLCVNDNDTLVEFRLLPEGPVGLLNFSSFGGSADFGYPNRWIKVILADSGSIHGGRAALFSVSGFLIMLAVAGAAFLLITIVSRAVRTRRGEVRVNSAFEEVPAGSGAIMQQQAGSHPDQPVIVHAREFINVHISEPLRPEQLAGGLGVSLRNLERIFKREMNMTPNAFITLIRIEFAAGMLSGGIHNIADVADAAGFNDPAYFSRVFKKHYGQTPREYHSNSQKAGRI
jgi:AraC-like DNA-binding protein